MIYGIGSKALADQLAIDETEAASFIKSFKARYSGRLTTIILLGVFSQSPKCLYYWFKAIRRQHIANQYIRHLLTMIHPGLVTINVHRNDKFYYLFINSLKH